MYKRFSSVQTILAKFTRSGVCIWHPYDATAEVTRKVSPVPHGPFLRLVSATSG